MEIWTNKGFQKIYNIEKKIIPYFLRIELDYVPLMYLECGPDQLIVVKRKNNIESLVKAKDLKPIEDAVVIYSEKYGNSLCPIKKIKKIEKETEVFLIELEEDVRHFAFDIGNQDKFKVFDNEETVKTLNEINTNDFIKVNDDYKKIVAKYSTNQNIHLAIDYQDHLFFANNILVKSY